jgi:CTP:molybdopterin cytidylyltransferase MocA
MRRMDVLSGVVLAAGGSRRMEGYIKPLLTIHGITFLERIVDNLKKSAIEEIVVVLGSHHLKIMEGMRLEGVTVLINECWEHGQLSSLKLATHNLSTGSDGMLFTLVDHPLVKLETYSTLIDFWTMHKKRIVIPTSGGRKGHPTIFPRSVYSVLLNTELPHGARDIICMKKNIVSFIKVADTGVVEDIDTIDDYRRLIGDPE